MQSNRILHNMGCVHTLEHVQSVYPKYVSPHEALGKGHDPLSMFTTPSFDGILEPLEPSNSGQTKSSEYAAIFSSSFPESWSSSMYPGMSMTEYTFLRNRKNPHNYDDVDDNFPISRTPKVYGSNTLWGSRSNSAGPWVIPGVPPASQSTYITDKMFMEAAGYK